MFDQLFSLPAVRARHWNAPLTDERQRFLEHHARLGLSRRTLQEFAPLLLVIVGKLGLANRPGVSVSRIEIQQRAIVNRDLFVSVATRWLEFLGRLEPPPNPANRFADKIDAFTEHMRRERDLSPVTISGRCRIVREFLERLSIPGNSLREISARQIDDALLGMVSRDGYARRTVQGWASHLRVFLRFAETHGWCRSGLASMIQSPRIFAMASLPRGPSWDEIQRLLAMTEGNRPLDIRDRAVLLLLAVYGLRAGEVRLLRLEDFDWEAELVRVWCPKTRQVRMFPLAHPVGDAILRYLKEVRPRSSHRQLFLTLVAPIRPLHGLWDLVGKRLRKIGVMTPHLGPHSLRHACATHLLAAGFSMKEIGDQLGHRLPNTTRIYAKVDLTGLRQVADMNLEEVL